MHRFILICALVLGGFVNTSIAHQQKEAYITLLFNQRTGNLEASHRFLLHDAEHGINQVLQQAGDLSTDIDTQRRFANYLRNNFAISDDSGQPLSLINIGFEVQGKYFWVYQETKIPMTKTLRLKHTALHELWPSQTNHLNIEKDGWVKSVRLQKRDSSKWHTIELSEPISK